MGSAMLRSWLDQNLVNSVYVIDPHADEGTFNDERIKIVKHHDNSPIHSDLFIIAVKPQILFEASKDLTSHLSIDTPVLSIAAGQSLNSLERIFGSNHPIIRCMPNTPAAIGKGMSVAIGNQHANKVHKKCVTDTLSCSGQVQWVEDETLMDAVTALSGSGPAYVFYLIEALAQAGESIGLNAEMSMTLARQTVIGASALAENESNLPASILRENVTSPGGTTQAALERLMDGRFQDILNEALDAARSRSIELNT